MEKKKILITGGLGYIGSHTTVVFLEAGYEIIIVDNLANSYMQTLQKIKDITGEQPQFYDADITDYKALTKPFKEHPDIDGIIHFAGLKAVGESCQNPIKYYENNVEGTLNIIKLMKEFSISNIVFSSSATVYDANNILPPFSENDRTNTTNPYGTTKLVNEYLLRDMALFNKYNVLNLRYFNPIGSHHAGTIGENPKGEPSNLLPVIFDVLTQKREFLNIYGNDYKTEDGTGVRDYIHVMDLAEAHLLAYKYIEEFLTYKNKDTSNTQKGLYDVFNIGLGEGVSVKSMVDLVEKVTENKIPTKVVGRRSGDVDTSIANSQKAKQILGRTPKRTIYQAIEDARRYIQKMQNT